MSEGIFEPRDKLNKIFPVSPVFPILILALVGLETNAFATKLATTYVCEALKLRLKVALAEPVFVAFGTTSLADNVAIHSKWANLTSYFP